MKKLLRMLFDFMLTMVTGTFGEIWALVKLFKGG